MAIPWKPEQRRRIVRILGDHKLDSGRCENAARAILPVATQCDPRAHILRITPRGKARYVEPVVSLAKPWYFHVTTEVALHRVDVLTGADGTEIEDYLAKHWKNPEWLEVKRP